MGIGIWSMHYLGMLAFRLPVPVQYDWPTVLLSPLPAILASAVALFVVSRSTMGFLEIHDNGKGISEEGLSGKSSLGILGMRERALLLGGTLTISSTLGKGTTLRVLIPDSSVAAE